jgi:anti-anti-sigma factor
MMIKTKGLAEQVGLNDRLKETLYRFSEEKDPNLETELKRVGDVPQGVCVALRGQIRTENSRYFARQLRRLLRSCLTRVILDMKNCTYMSSTGVGVLIHFVQEAREAGGDVVLVDLQPKVRSIVEVLGLTGFVGLENTREDGARYLLQAFWN